MNTTNPASPPPPLSPFQGFALGWSRYAEFRGRSSRVEFWSFQIINFFIVILLSSRVISLLISGVMTYIYLLVVLVPLYSVWVRRHHDMGRSDWWVFSACVSFTAPTLFIVSKVPGSIFRGHDIVRLLREFGLTYDRADAEAAFGFLILAFLFSFVMHLIPLIMCFVDGDPETNKYGPNPKLNPTNPNSPP